MAKRLLLWFRNDLRVHDNYIINEAVQQVKSGSCSEVVPVFCFDPRFFGRSAMGMHKTGTYRAQFQLECVLNLKQSLRSLGSDLLISVGKPEDVLPGLLQGCDSNGLVLTQQETTSEELGVDKKVAAAVKGLGRLQQVWGLTMFHLADLPFRPDLTDMPDVFTPFKEKVEARSSVRKEVPTPAPGDLPLPKGLPAAALEFTPTYDDLPYPPGDRPACQQPDPRAAIVFKGSEAAALQRLQYYLWDKDLIADYFHTRNGMLGPDYSTKLSAWLALGCISPRRVYHEVRRYESQRQANKSTYWVIFEMIWRDYFRFFSHKHGNAIFHEKGVSGSPPTWNTDPEAFRRWCKGRTGMPLVDANMREMNATGVMSNRGRQNVASYLVLDLGVDWRKGADYFESMLTDYDVASNWGNWVAAAGLTGGRVNKFNIAKQSKDYDPDGNYIRHWLPELARVPASRIHEPWLMGREEAEQYGVELGVTYPTPMHSSRQVSRYPPGNSRPGPSRPAPGPRSGPGPSAAPSGGRGSYEPRSSGRGRPHPGGRSYRKSEFEMYG